MLKSAYQRWSKLSLSARILVGLGLGIFTGLFVGEPAAVLQPAADIYIRLMQMTVLPYLVTSLIVAFGQLDTDQAKRLALRAGGLLLVVWAVTALVLVAVPLTFPSFDSASFYSHALVEPRQPFSLTDIYFTSNPFESLASNIVPAVVLFSCLIGVGMMGLEGKNQVLDPLRVGNAAIVRVTHFVINLTPYGVFAIGAVSAGTMDPETLTRLEVYFIGFTIAALLLAFWILPLMVTAVTPFRYREVAGIARDALLTAFVAHSAFIVLPILVERSKLLLERHGLLDESADAAAEVMIPVMFNFPNAGKLLTLLFVPFAAWLSGAALGLDDYSQLLAAGIPSYFAKAQIALPYLLDIFGLPHDLFQLYIPTTIITGKFDSLVTAMNLLVFALLGAGAMGGFLVFRARRLLLSLAGILGGTALLMLTLRFTLVLVIDTDYNLDQAVRDMHRAQTAGEVAVLDAPPPAGGAPATLQEIRARGSLRIGFDPDNLPMSFYNNEGELVGFDVELAAHLARALGLRAEFVPVAWSDVPRLLAEGAIDVMPGVWYRPYWFSSLRLTEPYFTGTVGLAVRDDRRHEFGHLERIREARGLKIGVPLDTTQIAWSMERYFGGTDAEFVPIETWRPYFEGRHPEIDAFLLPAEHASGWSLLHPEFSVVVPQPNPVRLPSAFGVALSANELAAVIDQWIVFAVNAGLVDRSFRYWINGQGAKKQEPRWSIMRDVLGWRG